MKIRLFGVLVLAALPLACGKKTETPATNTAASSAPAAPVGGLASGHAPGGELPPGHPAVEPGAPPAGAVTITGKVMETMDSGGYTYMKLGDVWVAVPATKVTKGETLTVIQSMVMENFESRTLGRKFDKLVFAVMAGAPPAAAAAPGAAAPATAMQQVAAQHAAAASGPSDVGDVKVQKAAGGDGRTIAEVYAGKADLAGKEVVVRGTVVKFLPQIMGKNWIHIRDGSGSHDAKTDDLTVTTAATAKPGDVVTIRGVVRTDRDFGAGYAYSVIVEDGKVEKN